MLGQLASATVLLAACVVVHAFGTVAMLRQFRSLVPSAQAAPGGAGRVPRPLLHLAASFILIFFLHVIEMALWAGAYWSQGALATFEEALYFSIVSFTTVGYGDIILPQRWRIFGAAEAATGNLLLGWSTGLMFAIIQRVYREIDWPDSSK